MVTRLRRWIRYQRALNRLAAAELDMGYNLNECKWQRLEAQARAEAGYGSRPAPGNQ